MALTPEDVVNKRFQHVKFRDGYDQDEVDDFLDEVVVELRRVYQENDELRQKLSAAEQKLASGGSVAAESDSAPAKEQAPAANANQDPEATQAFTIAPAAPAEAPVEEVPEAPKVEERPVVAAAQPTPAVSSKVAPAAEVGGAGPQASATGGPNDAHGLIELAQRLHDEHVAKGEARRDELISDAEKKAKKIVGEAEDKRRNILSNLESEQASLDREIDTLRNFERQYRTRLKSYLSDQLRDLESHGSLVPETLGDKANKHSI